ncbi:MAG: AAA domain-containing protein [Gammaproteobacteria bacterium]|nr:AAA domain-containing protein [Gammaproteobacteria bacterium]
MQVDEEWLEEWRQHALRMMQQLAAIVVGQSAAIRMCTIAVFARGHVLLEGDVGVGKTTLLRALSRAVGGAYERVEGTIDMMPSDLIYYTYIDDAGKPKVSEGPLVRHGKSLVTFFFNEINRARPQVHSLLLRFMAERTVSAFNREYHSPHMLVFADRNRIEKEETFELPSAARDRFLMDVAVHAPADEGVQKALMFEPRYHDPDELIRQLPEALIDYLQLNRVARQIQAYVGASDTLRDYALALCRATANPATVGVSLADVDAADLVEAGASPRGMSMLLRASRVVAWLDGRDVLIPEDLHDVFAATIAHRVFFRPVHELRRAQLAAPLMRQILQRVPAP